MTEGKEEEEEAEDLFTDLLNNVDHKQETQRGKFS